MEGILNVDTISCKKFTVRVKSRNGVIYDIYCLRGDINQFGGYVGKPLRDLVDYANRYGWVVLAGDEG